MPKANRGGEEQSKAQREAQFFERQESQKAKCKLAAPRDTRKIFPVLGHLGKIAIEGEKQTGR